jgi:hypothetical protein
MLELKSPPITTMSLVAAAEAMLASRPAKKAPHSLLDALPTGARAFTRWMPTSLPLQPSALHQKSAIHHPFARIVHLPAPTPTALPSILALLHLCRAPSQDQFCPHLCHSHSVSP